MRKRIYCLRKRIPIEEEITIWSEKVRPFLAGFHLNHTKDEYFDEVRKREQDAGISIYFKKPALDSLLLRRTIKKKFPGYDILWLEDIGPENLRDMCGRRCRFCETRFTPNKSNHLYCSKECKNEARYEREGRKMPVTQKFCEICGKPMSKRAGAKTCKPACYIALYRKNKKLN